MNQQPRIYKEGTIDGALENALSRAIHDPRVTEEVLTDGRGALLADYKAANEIEKVLGVTVPRL